MKETVKLNMPSESIEAEGVKLNRKQRRASKSAVHKAKKQARNAAANSPVGRSINKAKSTAEFNSLIFSTRINILEMQDGCDATEMLASLAVILGTVAQGGAHQFGTEPSWVRQLHGSLRNVEAMCHAGYKWQAEYSEAMNVAVGVANSNWQSIDPTIFILAWGDAVGFSDRIWAHDIAKCEVSA